MFKNTAAEKYPRCEHDIGVSEGWAEEEGTLRIADIDNLRNFFAKFSATLSLLVEILSLEKLVECGNDFTVNLNDG